MAVIVDGTLAFTAKAYGDDEGRITGHQPGTATLTIRARPASTSLAVQAILNPAVSYQIAQNRITVRAGDVVRSDLNSGLWIARLIEEAPVP